MDTPPPVPKPRSAFPPQTPQSRPVPLPRTKLPATNDRVSASDIFRSISTVSKQITEDVAIKVTNSAKTANEKIEKSFIDGTKFAKGTLEKTLITSRAVRDSVTKSVIEGTKTAGQRLRKTKKMENADDVDAPKSTSMPAMDTSLFDNIEFRSPLLEQKRFRNNRDCLQNNEALLCHNLNASHLDDLSLFSSNSDSNTDTVSNFSHDSRDSKNNHSSLNLENEQMTYDTPRASRANSIVSSRSTPEVPLRRKKRESEIYSMRENSLYENWNLPNQTYNNKNGEPISTPETSPRPSKSTINEFDPLNTSTKLPNEGVSNELLLLESFLIGDTYGTIVATDHPEDNLEDFNESDYFDPPTPPERSDSLPFEPDPKPIVPGAGKDRNSNWYVGETKPTTVIEDEVKPSVMQKFSHMLKLDKTLNKSTKSSVQKVNIVARPPLNHLPVGYFSGTLTRILSGIVEDLFQNSQTRYCLLTDQKLSCYTEPTNSILKESFTLDSIYSWQILPASTRTPTSTCCFELSVSVNGGRSVPRKVLFSCGGESERRNWVQKITEHMTHAFPTKYTSEFTRCGWCYLKEGVTGEWRGAWVMLVRRLLVYYTGRDSDITTVDLRKTRCITTQEADEETKQLCPTDGSANLLLDCPNATLYLRFPHERELKGWGYVVRVAAHKNGAHIHHQQLTKEDVPVIVDKCINFIYVHGSLSEGIYRRAGGNVALSELLARFRRDAWSIQLSPGKHSEHDVAGVLKRFFRDLPEPLLPQETHDSLVEALRLEQESSRHAEFRRILRALPTVAGNTARKLFAHLHFLHTLAHANKMSAENLASVWAPTIMHSVGDNLQSTWSTMYVIRELISNFESIWEPSEAEDRREGAVRTVLMRMLSKAGHTTPKAAGDLRTWVYVKDRNMCFHIALTPSKTSSDLCIELCEKANMYSHLLMLEEVICNESMRRVVHIDEIVLDVVLRWGYWDEEDRKDNYLVVKENAILNEMEALKQTTLVSGELRFANESSKTFKPHLFEYQRKKLRYFKDKQGSQNTEEWNVADILWYLGHEPKRNPQLRWSITFIPRNNKSKRSKDRPWFGCTIAGSVVEDQLKWASALTFAEHANILPTPRLVVT